ncbi:MAG: hypothetical protein PHR47_04085 [Candidatus Pacebacteria bacterium]|nr:hypothetical protein [Candidatus Paceibacterota bacterium]
MIFYKCLKCEKKWQYPINICPFCFSTLERVKTTKNKVIASSKVAIPSLLHPKAPYYALVLEDEQGVKFAYKSMDEKKIGDDISFEQNIDKDAVAIWKMNYDILDGIEMVANLLGGFNLTEKSKVLILPTLVSPVYNYFRDNTSVEFLNAILDFLHINNVKDIEIATQSFDDFAIETLAQKSGLLDVCLKNKIVPFDLSKGDFIKKEKIEISKKIENADLILNLSVLKAGKGSSTENILKLIKKENYLALKYLYSEEEIVQQIKDIKNVVSIGEAISPQRIDKFSVFRNLIFASRNPINLDAVFNATGLVQQLPKYLRDINIADIPIAGRSILEVQRNIDIVL